MYYTDLIFLWLQCQLMHPTDVAFPSAKSNLSLQVLFRHFLLWVTGSMAHCMYLMLPECFSSSVTPCARALQGTKLPKKGMWQKKINRKTAKWLFPLCILGLQNWTPACWPDKKRSVCVFPVHNLIMADGESQEASWSDRFPILRRKE